MKISPENKIDVSGFRRLGDVVDDIFARIDGANNMRDRQKRDDRREEKQEKLRHKGPWRNLFFLEGGYSAPGSKTFATEAEAIAAQAEAICFMRADYSKCISTHVLERHKIAISLNTVTHAVAMPE